MWPPPSRNFFSSGMDFRGVIRPQMGAVFRRDAVGVWFVAAAESCFAGLSDRGDGAANEDDHVILGAEVTGVDVFDVDDFDREMVLFHDPPDPAGGHGTAVGVPEGDTGGLDLYSIVRGMARIEITIAAAAIDRFAGVEQVVNSDEGCVAAGVEAAIF